MGSSSTLYHIKFKKVLPFFAVPILLYVFIVIIPLINAFYYSLNTTYSYNLTWTGFNNYIKLINDDLFWFSLKNNIIIISVSIIFQVGPAFIVMVLMSSKFVFKSKFVQSLFFFPCVISPLVIAYVWQIMYNNRTGIINQLLAIVDLGSLKQNWLSDPNIVMTSICIPLAWQFIGYYLVILLAGFSSIDKEVLEVAEIDGATGFKKAIYIIIPLVKNTVNVTVLICITGGMKIFDQIFALTGGGPGYASNVLAMYSYTTSFTENNYGYGSTISIAMLLISLLIVITISKVRGAMKNDA